MCLKKAAIPLLLIILCIVLASCTKVSLEKPKLELKPREPKPYPGGPTVTQLLLQYESSQFSLIKSANLRESIIRKKPERYLLDLRNGDFALVEFKVTAQNGTLLAMDRFLFPLKGHAVFTHASNPDIVVHEESLMDQIVFPVNLPVIRQDVTIDFVVFTPTDSDSVESWPSFLAGRVYLKDQGRIK